MDTEVAFFIHFLVVAGVAEGLFPIGEPFAAALGAAPYCDAAWAVAASSSARARVALIAHMELVLGELPEAFIAEEVVDAHVTCVSGSINVLKRHWHKP